MPIGTVKIVCFRQSDEDLPLYSIDASGAANKYLNMSAANYGTAYNKTKYGISLWIKLATTPASSVTAYLTGSASGEGNLALEITDGGLARVIARFNSSGAVTHDGTTDLSDNAWHHIYAVVDTTLGTSAERLKLYIDGSEEGSHAAISLNDTASGIDHAARCAGDGSVNLDALIYQPCFFESNVPGIGDLYNAGNPKAVGSLSGLYSYLDCLNGNVTNDAVLATAWTNNNTVITSLDIP